ARRVRRHARHARRIAAHPGASPAHTARRHRHRASSHRRRKAHRPTVRPAPRTYCSHAGAPPGPVPGSVPHSVRIFRSHAISYDPGGHVSWDISMTRTDPSWRVAVKPGDVLRIRSAYDTSKASWYESMGIMVMFLADNDPRPPPPLPPPAPPPRPLTPPPP